MTPFFEIYIIYTISDFQMNCIMVLKFSSNHFGIVARHSRSVLYDTNTGCNSLTGDTVGKLTNARV